MSAVDARFAGPITTEHGVVDETTPVVIVNLLGVQADFFPDEARTLARHLLEAAARADRNPPDDWIDER